MENQEYLDQISAKSKPIDLNNKQSGFNLGGILHSKIFLVVTIGLGIFILLAIIGSLLGGNKKSLRTDLLKFQLHIDNTSNIINEYQPKVKSSILRSHSASLNNIISDTSINIANYINTKYGGTKNDPKEDANLVEQATTEKDAILNELFEAKINGNLDRAYAHRMTFEISSLMSEENSLLKDKSADEPLQAILNQSYSSLETLYNSFNEFSETK